MSHLVFKKVYKNMYQRYYQADFIFNKFPNKSFNLKDEVKHLKDRYEKADIRFLDEEINTICISDSTRHIERLAFIAGRASNDEKTGYNVYSFAKIDGKSGHILDSWRNEVQEDIELLTNIAKCNGFDSCEILKD